MKKIGLCVTDDKCESLAHQAVRRFRYFTGLPCMLLHCNMTSSSNPYIAKLEAPHFINDGVRVIQFDSDAWMVKRSDFSDLDGLSGFFACHDSGKFAPGNHPMHDCAVLGIDIRRYFNSGVIIYDSSKLIKSIFSKARNTMLKRHKDCKDFGEQSFLNHAVLNQGIIDFHLIDQVYNYIPFAVHHGFGKKKEEPVFVHAAGYSLDVDPASGKSKKEIALETYCGEHSSYFKAV